MKKLILGAAAFLFLGLTTITAQDAVKAEKTSKVVKQEQPQDAEKVEIKQDQLPASVKEKLASDEFKGWRVSTAYITKSEKAEIYVVELTDGKEKATHKFDKEGNKVG